MQLTYSALTWMTLHYSIATICATYIASGPSGKTNPGHVTTRRRHSQLTGGKSLASGRRQSNFIEAVNGSTSDDTLMATSFKNDQDIVQYLKSHGQQLMIWRCRNAIKPPYVSSQLAHVDLYCEVIGTIKVVSWFHNGKLINTYGEQSTLQGRYRQRISPHTVRQRPVRNRRQGRNLVGQAYRLAYSRWIDFRLRINRATARDSGSYVFKVTSPAGETAYQMIHVDLSEYNDNMLQSSNTLIS